MTSLDIAPPEAADRPRKINAAWKSVIRSTDTSITQYFQLVRGYSPLEA